MYQNVKNLDEAERILKNYFEINQLGWTIKRGKETVIHDKLIDSSPDYEVLQVFKPVRSNGKLPINEYPFAEFWKGHYYFCSNSYTAFYLPYFFKGTNKVAYCFNVPMGFAINGIIEEVEMISR